MTSFGANLGKRKHCMPEKKRKWWFGHISWTREAEEDKERCGWIT
jgi:hypothetical protein